MFGGVVNKTHPGFTDGQDFFKALLGLIHVTGFGGMRQKGASAHLPDVHFLASAAHDLTVNFLACLIISQGAVKK